MVARAFRLSRAYARARGRVPRLFRPRRYTEKMQHRKLFDFNPLFPILCDKIAVREFTAARVRREHLVPLLWSGAPVDVPFGPVLPRMMIEQTVTTADGARPDEVRLFVFDGKVAVFNTFMVGLFALSSGRRGSRAWFLLAYVGAGLARPAVSRLRRTIVSTASERAEAHDLIQDRRLERSRA